MSRSHWMIVLAAVVIIVAASVAPVVSAPQLARWSARIGGDLALARDYLAESRVARDAAATGAVAVLIALLGLTMLRRSTRRVVQARARRGQALGSIARSTRLSQDAVRLLLGGDRSP